MKYTRKTDFLSVVIITLLLYCGTAYSQTNTLTVGNGSGAAGSSGSAIPISLSNQEIVAGIIFTVNYDANVLTPSSVVTVDRTQNQSGLGFNIPTPGELLITMFDFDGNNLAPASGEIIRVLFDVSSAASEGERSVSISDEALSSTSYQPISVAVENGGFEVVERTAGDANVDGKIDIADVVFLISHILGDGPAPDPLSAGDANEDGKVDIADVVFLIDLILGG